VIDSIEEFLQIQINHPAVARRDVLLCLRNRLMSRPARPESKAAITGDICSAAIDGLSTERW